MTQDRRYGPQIDPGADKHGVAADAVDQYNIAVRQGDKKCVQVGLVAAAYLQAKNESEYIDWKDIETHVAAMPTYPDDMTRRAKQERSGDLVGVYQGAADS